MKANLLSLFIAITLVGCGAKVDDLVVYTNEIKQNTQVNIEPYPKFNKLEAVDYASADLRSPFEAIRQVQTANDNLVRNENCIQPNPNRTKSVLESYGIDALRMSGVFTTAGQKWALVKANDGSLHKVKRGQYIGLFNGRVTQITSQEIVIEEMLPDGAGCWKKKQAKMSMTALTGESDNV